MGCAINIIAARWMQLMMAINKKKKNKKGSCGVLRLLQLVGAVGKEEIVAMGS